MILSGGHRGAAPTAAVLAGVALASLAGACVDTNLVRLSSVTLPPDGGVRISESYIQGQTSADVLFVVDNSFGTSKMQAALAAGIGQFFDRLKLSQLDWRVGVISTDLGIDPFSGPGCTVVGGDRAELQSKPRLSGCTPPPDPYLTPSNVADPAAAFACIASLGEGGCGFERPIEAALRAANPATMPGANKGFFRDKALLMVIWVSNEDDCSASDSALYDPDDISYGPWTSFRCFAQDIHCTGRAADGSLTGCVSGKGSLLLPVKDAVQQLRAIRPQGVAALAVVGPPSPVKIQQSPEQKLLPSCESGGIAAVPGIRFGELVAELGEDGALVSVCHPNLGGELGQAVSRLRTSAGPHCLRHALRDPAQPGCAVEATHPDGSVTPVPPSSEGAAGFRITHPLLPGCENGALGFDEGATPPPGSEVRITCDFVAETS